MNKNKKFGKPIMVSFIIIIALIFNACSNRTDTLDNNGEKSERALNVYIDAVEKLKNEKDFNLKLTTSVTLKEVDCSLSIFNLMLEKAVNHRIGEIEDQITEFSFVDGALKEDKSISPKNIVQPANSDISKDLFDGIDLSYIYSENGSDSIYFVIGRETAPIDDIISAFEKMKDDIGSDFGNYDVHKEYNEIDALAKYHSNFINIMSVAPRVKNLLDLNNNHEHRPDDLSMNYGDFGKTAQMENGICYLGDTSVIAKTDKNGRLETVVFCAPIGVDVNVKLMHNQFKAVLNFEISQTYEYRYSE